MERSAFLPKLVAAFAIISLISMCSFFTSAVSPPSTIIKVFGNKATINATYPENVVLSYAKIIKYPDIQIPLQSVYPIPPAFTCQSGRKSYLFIQTFSQEGNYTFTIGVNDCVNNYREDAREFAIIFGPPPGCGDGFVNSSSGEECDDNNTRDGDGCSSRCQRESCGNNRTDAGEVCDGSSLNGQTCRTRGYQFGNLACSSDCKRFDVSNCSGLRCGNGVIDLGEECDGTNWGRITDCVSFDSSFTGGVLKCDPNTCRFLTNECIGFSGGTCGDKRLGVGEECDGIVRKKCSDFDNFFGDGLRCTANCTYDTSVCKKLNSSCGDGEVNQNAGEDCDGSSFAGGMNSCADFTSFTSGVLTCTANCSIDTSLCGVSNSLNASCLNQKKDGTEVDVDCGGICACCEVAKKCTSNSECCQSYCKSGVCAAPSCTDGVKNGLESDVDCGGECENKCAENASCGLNSDCVTGYCGNGVCTQPSCDDGVQNGVETDVDCGGECEARCAIGQACEFATDCESNFCEYGACSVDKSLDSDGDGMPDWWEDKYGLNKNDPSDADKDADGDGFSNLVEFNNGTDPTVFDEGGKSHLWNLIVLVIGLLLMVGSGGFLYYYREYYLPEHKKTQSRSSPTPAFGLPSQGGAQQRGQARPMPGFASSKPGLSVPGDSKSALLRRFLEKRQGGQPSKPGQSPAAGAKQITAQPATSSSKPSASAPAAKPLSSSSSSASASPSTSSSMLSDAFKKLKSISGDKGSAGGKSSSESLKELAAQSKKESGKPGAGKPEKPVDSKKKK